MINFFARECHHKAHAQPIAFAFMETVKDKVEELDQPFVCVFCYGDLKLVNRVHPDKKIIFCEHGAGMYYNNEHPSYAGSMVGRENVVLRLSPNQSHADKEKETLKCPVEIIGIPRLDVYAKKHFRVKTFRPTVAISFHWDCLVCPETRSSFSFFLKSFPDLITNFNVIGHGHPRIIEKIAPYYKRYGIKTVRDFDQVMKEADVYICDNSSTIYEWGITKKPIVLLNSPFYRKDVEHKGNPRFWKHAGIGPQVDRPEDLVSAVNTAISNRDYYLPLIESANADVLTYTDGMCTARAIIAIKKYIYDN
jgi:hypothetical protein